MSEQVIRIAHIVVTVLMIALILLQNRSGSQGGFLSGAGETFQARRGAEKVIFVATIILAVLFVILTIWILKL